mmetsp:Transcript_18189/g.42304  ORF Transcript_18189/g.42304 Transcript_18189/m.42304 type:complete len:491 (+) Transcript_18189:31-1503(+)
MATQSHGDMNCGWRADTAEYDGEELAHQWSRSSLLSAGPELQSPEYSDGATFNSNDSFPGSNISLSKHPSEAAQTEVDDNTQGHLQAQQTHPAQPSPEPREASQFFDTQSPRCSQVLHEATRIAVDAADAQKRVLQRQMSVDERGCEADALLEEIAKAGSSKAQSPMPAAQEANEDGAGLLEAAMLAEMSMAEQIDEGSQKLEAAASRRFDSPPSSFARKGSAALMASPAAESPLPDPVRDEGAVIAAPLEEASVSNFIKEENEASGEAPLTASLAAIRKGSCIRASPGFDDFLSESHSSRQVKQESPVSAPSQVKAEGSCENTSDCMKEAVEPTLAPPEGEARENCVATHSPSLPNMAVEDANGGVARQQPEFTVTPPISQAVSPPNSVRTPEPCVASVVDRRSVEHPNASELGHSLRPPELGMLARIVGDGWGGGDKRKRSEGTITEADEYTFTVIVKESDNKWTETHVLREHCALLEGSKPAKRQKK